MMFPLKPTGRSFKRNDPLHTEERPLPFKGTGGSLKIFCKAMMIILKFQYM